jgi:hypothetical protein
MIETLNPEKDLEVGGKQLKDFIDNISPRYFREEITLPGEVMERTTDVMSATGKKEFESYSFFNAMKKERAGVATIVIDCSKLVPQQKFAELTQGAKEIDEDRIGHYEFYAERAYSLAVTIEVFNQMIKYAESKPRLRPEDRQFLGSIAGLKKRFSEYGQVSADVAGDTRSYICESLESFAKYFGLQKFVLLLSNTQAIPPYVKKDLMHMFYRGHGENDTSVMFLAKEKTPKDVDEKVAELHERLGKGINSQYRKASDDLMKALGTYQMVRKLKQEFEDFKIVEDEDRAVKAEKENVLRNLIGIIKGQNHNFFDLHEEFHTFTDEEIKVIQQRIFTP